MGGGVALRFRYQVLRQSYRAARIVGLYEILYRQKCYWTGQLSISLRPQFQTVEIVILSQLPGQLRQIDGSVLQQRVGAPLGFDG